MSEEMEQDRVAVVILSSVTAIFSEATRFKDSLGKTGT